jgi:hypothetical protein
MSPLFITTIIGIILAVLTLGQVAPSVIQAITAKKVEVGITREDSLMQQIIRYNALQGSYPADMAALISGGYWQTANNDNGFGGNYSFTINGTQGTITISTTIADDTKRAQYLNNYRHVFRPVDAGGGVVTTTFVMPSTNALGAPIGVAGNIPVGATAPSAATNTWWYDTSGGSAVLMISDGATWKDASLSTSGISSSNIVSSVSNLPSSASEGDIKYVYDAATNSLTGSYVYYNGGWVLFSSGAASSGGGGTSYTLADCNGTAGNGSPVSTSACIQTATVSAGTSCTWNQGVIATDGAGNYFACQDLSSSTYLGGTSCSGINRVTYDVDGSAYQCE